MYIGGVDAKGLHHLVWEIVDNAVDEYLNGYADDITVTLHKSGDAVTVTDNGRGIPVDMHPKHKKPALELVLTTLHAGGKFGDDGQRLHPLRRPARRRLVGRQRPVEEARRHRPPRRLRVAADLRQGHAARRSWRRSARSAGTARSSTSSRTPTIFKTTHFDADMIKAHLEDMAYIHSGLKITFKNEATGETLDLAHPGGLPEFLPKLVSRRAEAGGHRGRVLTPPRDNGEKMEVALQWTESTDETYPLLRQRHPHRRPAARTRTASRARIVKAIRNYIETHEIKIKGLKITAEDIREGVVGVLSVFVREPMFQGQTKERLNNPEMTATVENFVRPALEAWLNTNRTAADQIVGRIVLAAQARQASRDAADEVKRKSPGSRRLNLPGKLADCKSHRPGTRRSCSSSRATRPAGRRSRAATTAPRPCCRCAARSSTPRGCRPARCCRTRS